ncbi:4a-hydroxytetrahydrobiopterin dehydratase [Gammaproteobacteria bacterium]|nr:4a-hydroxytetrahydrobiopterin dehydratase [Gammaproteobacteria bacterium]
MILSKQHIVATPKGASTLSIDEKTEYMSQLPGWQMISVDTIEQLYKSYPFKSFNAAMAFANKISIIAEQCDHHPRLSIEWAKLSVYWWSHSIGGLHINDLVMAAKTDEIYNTL